SAAASLTPLTPVMIIAASGYLAGFPDTVVLYCSKLRIGNIRRRIHAFHPLRAAIFFTQASPATQYPVHLPG
ncbi:hypothetical protein, partial [Trabulsiella odontotermitis]|uniref:hypothetical protein n=1 Tax=Trabulsiella odontotermitis TaxID=379893 RepID=UPI001EDED306